MLKTSYVHPPIPIRGYDWAAYDDDTYDGAPDAGPQIVGHGPTEEQAIANYIEQLREEFPVACYFCGTTREGISALLMISNIHDPVCCYDAAWESL